MVSARSRARGRQSPTLRRCAAIALVAILAASCADRDETRIVKARDAAKRFHGALINNDVRELVEHSLLPFNFDNRAVVGTTDELAKLYEQNGPAMRKQTAAANYLEVVTYEEFVDGAEIGGASFEGEEAEAQARKIGFAPNDILVRLLHQDEDGRRDGRFYVLVMRENQHGYFRVATYYD